MKAIKENKEYTVDEITKNAYLAQGFNICNDDGKVLERPAGASVSYEDFAALEAENISLKNEIKALKSADAKDAKKG